MSAALAAAAVTPRIDGTGTDAPINDVSMVGFLASVAVAGGLCLRRRSPRWLLGTALVACLPPLLLPTDSLAALIGMAAVVVHHRDPRARWGVGIAASLATLVAVWKDTRGTRSDTSFWNSFQHPNGTAGTWTAMPLWGVVLISALLVAATLAIAAIRRSRSETHVQHQRAEQAQAHAVDLSKRLTEHDERDALAREVHDVLGHRLSILSMQASALEIEAEGADSPEVRERARQIQEGAAGSMGDLRSLLRALREGPASSERPAELSDIADLVRECIDAGTPVSSNVFVDQSQPLEPIISRSAHRITTELLTNARKHAPGQTVHLEITGGPREGLVIRAENPLTGARPGIGSGIGLTGVGRRAQDVGGSFEAGPSADGRRYRAVVRLPWRLPT